MEDLEPSDWIGLVGLVMTIITLPMITVQFILSNRLSKAQILQSRFDMYWRATEPVSDDRLRDFMTFPRDRADIRKFDEKYKNNRERAIKNIGQSLLVEYLAYLHTLRYKMKVSDPLGDKWLELWVSSLVEEEEFLDALLYYKDYYPDLFSFAVRLRGRASELSGLHV